MAAYSRIGHYGYVQVPSDMLLCIYEAVMLTYHNAAMTGGIDSKDIGADILFPILVSGPDCWTKLCKYILVLKRTVGVY